MKSMLVNIAKAFSELLNTECLVLKQTFVELLLSAGLLMLTPQLVLPSLPNTLENSLKADILFVFIVFIDFDNVDLLRATWNDVIRPNRCIFLSLDFNKLIRSRNKFKII